LYGRFATSFGRDVQVDGVGLPYGSRTGPCLVWLLKPRGDLKVSEAGRHIIRLESTDWIDLGFGVPPEKLA
jgi:hypothetical protein